MYSYIHTPVLLYTYSHILTHTHARATIYDIYTYSTCQMHLRQKHFDHLCPSYPMAPQENIPELNSDTLSDNIQMPKSSTQKEVDHLSQCSLDNIVGKVTSTAQETLFRVERHVSCTLGSMHMFIHLRYIQKHFISNYFCFPI